MRGMNKNSVVVVDDERLATQSEFLFQLERERELHHFGLAPKCGQL
jgi:hypothetical protein